MAPNRVGRDSAASPDALQPDPELAGGWYSQHQAAAHDAWFRGQVEESLREADRTDAIWMSQDDVRAESAARRAAWTDRAATVTKNAEG